MSSLRPSRGSLVQSCQIIYHFITVFIISDQSGEYFKTKQYNIIHYIIPPTHPLESQALILPIAGIANGPDEPGRRRRRTTSDTSRQVTTVPPQ